MSVLIFQFGHCVIITFLTTTKNKLLFVIVLVTKRVNLHAQNVKQHT